MSAGRGSAGDCAGSAELSTTAAYDHTYCWLARPAAVLCHAVLLPSGVADLLSDVLSGMRDAARGVPTTSSSSSSLLPGLSGGAQQCCRGLLLLGRPGVGKTTLLRDVARLMSNPVEAGGLGMAVIIVDTSNEIAGGWGLWL